MEKFIDDSRIHEGHRGRMRAKLLAHGQRIFDTYELLEMLLYHTIPYKDTNPISKRLLMAFGGLDGVLSADGEELKEQSGIGQRTSDFLVDVGLLSDILGAEILTDQGPDLSSYDAVGRYLTDYFSGVSTKQVVALYLDSGMRLLSFKKLYDLEYESGGVKAKPFIDGAIECSAAVVITAHNHPFGPFYPTQGDRATNLAITDAMQMSGILHAEHYIICGEHYAGIGSLQNFNVKLSQMPAVGRFFESRDSSGNARLSSVSSGSRTGVVAADNGYNRKDSPYLARLLSYQSGDDAQSRADMLINKYHTIENILCASPRELASLTDERCAFYVKTLAYICSRRRTDLLKNGGVYTRAEIADYLKALYVGESVEKTYLIGFDGRGRFIGCELLGEGTVTSSEVLPRKAIDVALGMSARTVSIAHNHPFGTTRASSDDVSVTKLFEMIFNNCDIKLLDHYIIAGQLCDTVDL